MLPNEQDRINSPFPPRNAHNTQRKELRRNSGAAACSVILMYALRLGLTFLTYFILSRTIGSAVIRNNYDAIYWAVSFAVFVVAFAVSGFVAARWVKIPAHVAVRLKPVKLSIVIPATFCCLGLTLAGGTLSMIISLILETTLSVKPTMPDLTTPTELIPFMMFFCAVVIAPSFFEEILFRGVIMQSLRRFGDMFALVMSSILFCMAHGNLVQGPNTLILGFAIGFFVMRTGSLWTGIIIHFVNNMFAVFLDLAFTSIGSNTEMYGILNGIYFMVYIVGAIAGFIYLVTRHPGFFRLESSGGETSARKKSIWFFTTVFMILLTIMTIVLTVMNFEVVA